VQEQGGQDQGTLAEPDTAGRRGGRRRTAAIVGAVGVLGGVVAGGAVVASAASPGARYSGTASECTGEVAVPAPALPYRQTRFLAGGSTVSGTVPAPDAAALGGLIAKSVRVDVTTQYNSAASGGRTDVATVTLPARRFTNPLLFAIPPVTNAVILAPGAVPYSVKTGGRATALVTVAAYVVDAARVTRTTVLGDGCPAGTTQTGFLQGMPTPSPASGGSSASPSASGSPSATPSSSASASPTASPLRSPPPLP